MAAAASARRSAAAATGAAVLWALAAPARGMMFQSTAVTSQWDTWAFVENGTFYAYYLITEHSPGEGFGVATSADGVTGWTDHGYVWHSPDWAEHRWWEGTGAVWRAADFNKTGRYVINYSRCPGKYQQITFAESFDLIHWSRPAPFNGINFNISAGYKNPGRWDCIYSTPLDPTGPGGPRDGYPRVGWWTATAANAGGDMGFGKTEDGWTWEALPSPVMNPPINSETGAVERVTYANGTRALWVAMLGHGGMVVYTASQPQGPYTIQPKNAWVLTGSCYFARFFRPASGDVFVTHQSFSHQGRTYIAPFKRVEVDDEGVMRLKYFDTVGKLTAAPLPSVSNASAPWFTHTANVSVGAVVEATLRLPGAPPPPAPPPGGPALISDPAFVVEMVGGDSVAVAVNSTGHCTVATVGPITAAGRPVPATKALGAWDRELGLSPGDVVTVRLLFRRDMLELYLNDYLLPVQLMPAAGTGRLGLLPNGASGGVTVTGAWAMALPGTPVWPPPAPPPPPPAPPVPAPPGDLSPHGAATCSGVFSKQFPCGAGIDGNLATRWSSEEPYDGSPRWLAVHFDRPTTVTKATMVWELAYAKGYELQVANASVGARAGAGGAGSGGGGAVTWSTFYNTTSGVGKTETASGFGAVTGTDFRIYCYERFHGSPWGFSLWEWELFA